MTVCSFLDTTQFNDKGVRFLVRRRMLCKRCVASSMRYMHENFKLAHTIAVDEALGNGTEFFAARHRKFGHDELQSLQGSRNSQKPSNLSAYVYSQYVVAPKSQRPSHWYLGQGSAMKHT